MEAPGETQVVAYYERVQANLASVQAKVERLLNLRRDGKEFPEGKIGTLQYEERRLRALMNSHADHVFSAVIH